MRIVHMYEKTAGLKARVPNPYMVKMVRVRDAWTEVPGIRTLELGRIKSLPGQFVMLSVPGIGESAISISSYPDLRVSVQAVGNVTKALCRLGAGDMVGLRGPYGQAYPLESLAKRPVVLVAGGIGLAPLRSLVRYFLKSGKKDVLLFAGARNDECIPFRAELADWSSSFPVNVTVDRCSMAWKGRTGFVTELIRDADIPKGALAVLCGPPPMVEPAGRLLIEKGIRARDITITVERNMSCAVGMCGHCNIGPGFVCERGPGYSWPDYHEMKGGQ